MSHLYMPDAEYMDGIREASVPEVLAWLQEHDPARRLLNLTSPETIEAWGMVREGLLNHEMPPALWSALGILDHHFTVLRSVEEGTQ